MHVPAVESPRRGWRRACSHWESRRRISQGAGTCRATAQRRRWRNVCCQGAYGAEAKHPCGRSQTSSGSGLKREVPRAVRTLQPARGWPEDFSRGRSRLWAAGAGPAPHTPYGGAHTLHYPTHVYRAPKKGGAIHAHRGPKGGDAGKTRANVRRRRRVGSRAREESRAVRRDRARARRPGIWRSRRH